MLISFATIVALSVLCALLIIWGHRHAKAAEACEEQLWRTQEKLARSSVAAEQWRAETVRLRAIVDRVEG